MDIFPAELYLHIHKQITHLCVPNLVFIMAADERLGICLGLKSKDKCPQTSFDHNALRFCGTPVGSLLVQKAK